MVKYSRLNVDAPFIFVLQRIQAPAGLRFSVEIATIAGLTSVALVSLLGQPRIFFSMAKDGLLPRAFSRLHPRFRTPFLPTLVTGAVCAVVAGLLPLDLLGELISIGTLMAFAIVCLGILVLRRTRPDLPRPFRTPWVPLVPLLRGRHLHRRSDVHAPARHLDPSRDLDGGRLRGVFRLQRPAHAPAVPPKAKGEGGPPLKQGSTVHGQPSQAMLDQDPRVPIGQAEAAVRIRSGPPARASGSRGCRNPAGPGRSRPRRRDCWGRAAAPACGRWTA